MKLSEVEEICRSVATSVDGRGAEHWRCVAHDIAMQIYVSPPKDRMRVMSMVMGAADLRGEHLRGLLEGNFHSDARYAVYDGIVYAVYLHTLSTLRESDLRCGIRQVAELTKSFGHHHAGSPLRFDWPRPDPVSEGTVRRRNVDAVQDGMRRGGEPPKR